MNNRKAVLGFVLVLILTLTLAGLTFWKLAEILGMYHTNKALDSFQDFIDKVNDTSIRPVGTKQSMPIYLDEKSAIIGFNSLSNEVLVTSGINHHSPRPSQCGSQIACICLCRDYSLDAKLSYGIDISGVICKGDLMCYDFKNFDLPSILTKQDYGLPVETEGGFIMARNDWMGGKSVDDRLKSVYITKEREGLVSISFSQEGLSQETIGAQDSRLRQIDYIRRASTTHDQAIAAFTKKDYDTAILKLEELISSGDIEKLNSGPRDFVYYYLGMAYLNKGNKEKAIEILDKGISYTDDDGAREVMRKKIAEIEAG